MSTKLINLTRLTQQVKVRHADQKLDCIQIMGQGRVDLRDGMAVDTRWLQANPLVLRVVKEEAPIIAQAGDE